MSFLDRPKHAVTVQRRERQVKAHGSSLTNLGTAVSVPCNVRALTATETSELGLGLDTVYRIVAREWPGDVLSLITWNGDKWEPVGDPLWFDGSPRTQHWEIRVKQVSPDGEGV